MALQLNIQAVVDKYIKYNFILGFIIMKIKQILEGRAEEIDKQIAALRAEKAALGGGDPDLQSGGEFDPKHDADNARSVRADGTDARVARDAGASGPPGRNYGKTNVAGASGPPGRNYATRRPGTPRPGTGEYGPANRYAPKQVAAGTGQYGPANRYQPKPNYATGGDPLLQSGGEFDREHDGDPFLQNLIKNAGITKKQAQTLERPIHVTKEKKWKDPDAMGGDTGGGKFDPIHDKEKNTGNLLKWYKQNAKKPEPFDQDMANK